MIVLFAIWGFDFYKNLTTRKIDAIVAFLFTTKKMDTTPSSTKIPIKGLLHLPFTTETNDIVATDYFHHGLAENGKYLFAFIEKYDARSCMYYGSYSTGTKQTWCVNFAGVISATINHCKQYSNYGKTTHEQQDTWVLLKPSCYPFKHEMWLLQIETLKKYGIKRIKEFQRTVYTSTQYFIDNYYATICEDNPVYASFYDRYKKCKNNTVKQTLIKKHRVMNQLQQTHLFATLLRVMEQTEFRPCDAKTMLFSNDYLIWNIWRKLK